MVEAALATRECLTLAFMVEAFDQAGEVALKALRIGSLVQPALPGRFDDSVELFSEIRQVVNHFSKRLGERSNLILRLIVELLVDFSLGNLLSHGSHGDHWIGDRSGQEIGKDETDNDHD